MYTTEEKVKARLSNYNDDWDELLKDLIRASGARINTYCGRDFRRLTHTQELHDGLNSNGGATGRIFLKNYPVVSITTLSYRSSKAAVDSWLDYYSYDYDVDLSAGIVSLVNGSFPAETRNLRATYVAGYLIDFTDEDNSAVHTLPADITWAATELCVRWFNNREKAGQASEGNSGGSSLTRLEDMDKEIREVLDSWRKIDFAV